MNSEKENLKKLHQLLNKPLPIDPNPGHIEMCDEVVYLYNSSDQLAMIMSVETYYEILDHNLKKDQNDPL